MAGISLKDLKSMMTKNFSGDDLKFRDASGYTFKDGTTTGKLEKAKLRDENGKEFIFQFNPQTVTITKKAKPKDANTGAQNVPSKQFTGGVSRTITFPDLIFDTFEDKASVYTTYIQKLETFLHFDSDLHRPPKVLLVWGKFLQKGKTDSKAQQSNTKIAKQIQEPFECFVTEMSVNYTMFLEDGTPVRAKVKLTLEEVGNKDKKNSPDHAKVYTVRRGDTLQNIAYREYDNPGEWRRIAKANNIDDPMNIKPGTKLLIPPILK